MEVAQVHLFHTSKLHRICVSALLADMNDETCIEMCITYFKSFVTMQCTDLCRNYRCKLLLIYFRAVTNIQNIQMFIYFLAIHGLKPLFKHSPNLFCYYHMYIHSVSLS